MQQTIILSGNMTKQKIKIENVWLTYVGRTETNSLNEIPTDFMAKFYNGAYRLFYKNKCVYAISEFEYKNFLATA